VTQVTSPMLHFEELHLLRLKFRSSYLTLNMRYWMRAYCVFNGW